MNIASINCRKFFRLHLILALYENVWYKVLRIGEVKTRKSTSKLSHKSEPCINNFRYSSPY